MHITQGKFHSARQIKKKRTQSHTTGGECTRFASILWFAILAQTSKFTKHNFTEDRNDSWMIHEYRNAHVCQFFP